MRFNQKFLDEFGATAHNAYADAHPEFDEYTDLQAWNLRGQAIAQYQWVERNRDEGNDFQFTSRNVQRDFANIEKWRGRGLSVSLAFFKKANIIAYDDLTR